MKNLSYEEQKKALSKFGKVETMCQSVYNYEFLITDGFSSNIDNTLAFMEMAKQIAGAHYNRVKTFTTDEDMCLLILTKQ